MSNDLLSGVAKSLNTLATPQSAMTQLVTSAINSSFTKETIRSMILDPVTKLVIPSVKKNTMRDSAVALVALYKICPDEVVKKIIKDENIDKRKKEMNEHLEKISTIQMMMYELSDAICGKDKVITELIRYKGTIIYTQLMADWENYIFTMNLWFVGPTAKSVHREFQEKYNEVDYDYGDGIKEKNKRRVSVYTFDDGGRRPRHGYATVPNTVIVDHVEKELQEVMNMVRKSEDVSKDFELNKTTGVLLYGPHGTGKSTIARWLAMNLDRSILLTNADTLMMVIDYVKDHPNKKFIILIEDIDFKFVDRRESKKDDKNTEMMKNTDLLFQVLDGVLGENNLMVIATTNYIDRLDPALIRDSRFDFRIEVLGLSYEEAAKVCERFCITPEEIKLSEWDLPISPASLQTFILKYKVS